MKKLLVLLSLISFYASAESRVFDYPNVEGKFISAYSNADAVCRYNGYKSAEYKRNSHSRIRQFLSLVPDNLYCIGHKALHPRYAFICKFAADYGHKQEVVKINKFDEVKPVGYGNIRFIRKIKCER